MTPTFRDRYKGTITNTPGISGDLTINSALSGYQSFSFDDDGLYFDIVINDVGNTWEIRKDCQFNFATLTLSAGTFSDSNSGSPLALTNSAIWAVTLLSERTFPSTITNPVQDDVVSYDATLGRFINKAVSSSTNASVLRQYVKNGNGTTILKGQVVYISGASGNNVLISLAKADTDMTSATTIGFAAQDFAVNGFGYIITEGYLDGLNTNAATNEGDPIWLSPTTAGGVLYGMANKPHAPDHMVYLGVVSRKQINNGSIFIKCQNGYEISELHDVLITSPIQDDLLVRNGTTGIWENKNTLNKVQITDTTETLTKTDGVEGWSYQAIFNQSGQENAAGGISMSADGTNLYVVGTTNDTVYQYPVITPYDISTATTVGLKSYSVTSTAGVPVSIFFKPDGTAFYILNDSTTESVQRFNLSTAWDVSTATYVNSYAFTIEITPAGLEFSPDGLRMHIVGSTNDTVYQFALSTAWDLSTAATTATYTFSVTAFEAGPSGIEFNSDGTKMYIVGTGADSIIQYNLSTAWNITTAVYSQRLPLITSGFTVNSPRDVYVDLANNVMLIVDDSADRVFQYNTNTNALKIIGNQVIVNPKTVFNNEVHVQGLTRFIGSIEASNALSAGSTITLSGSASSVTTIGTSATTGITQIGGSSQTGTITVGQSTVSQTVQIGSGATTAVSTKTINIGSNGVSGSNTNINIGSAVTGAINNTTITGSVKFPTVGTSGIVGLGAGGLLSSVTIGSGLNLTSGTLTSTYSYTLPTASTTVLGGVKVDGTTVTINGSGVISAVGGGTPTDSFSPFLLMGA